VGAHFRVFMASFSVPSACCYPKTRLGGAAGAGASVRLAFRMREEEEEEGRWARISASSWPVFSVPLVLRYPKTRLGEMRRVQGHPSAWRFV
jgi:hypothetical protein